MNSLTIIASEQAAGEKAGLFESLGIDWTMLIMQTIAFLALLWLLNKYVFPVLMGMIDERDRKIEEGQRAAAEAAKAAESAEATTAKELEQARRDAAGIIETAHREAADLSAEAEANAQKKADHLLEQADARIQGETAAARKEMQGEMAGLVAAATERIIRQKLDPKTDAALIRRALEEAR